MLGRGRRPSGDADATTLDLGVPGGTLDGYPAEPYKEGKRTPYRGLLRHAAGGRRHLCGDVREALLAWSAESTEQLLGALRESGPERGCWTWWGASESPQTCGAVAQQQLQEVALHTYDAQITVGSPQPLPGEAALDGVDEFLSTCCAGAYRWPHEPAAVDYHAAEGRSWRLSLSADGARITRLPMPGTGEATDGADASARGTAGELVLALYGRIPVDSLKLDGDRRLFELLQAWDPDE
ncbi:maleylpyruvate isomerase N-terminal domain-containing protein [Streptomyces sp. V3I7]|uniref:maleylpyruvate isomerase N-terminal domain-containing protein n=1 Tax=Streptomyces sp. V3I7 TaxID=3042278 RepID=UPI00278A4156|nr:maleylpyruvate isomerase N-terminal domain-containing protein [Streptomyces sp. V3I7]MDQ0989483.1 uncharacterized protein (TIGR03083 family) [Streptomyces sp. V3I7]